MRKFVLGLAGAAGLALAASGANAAVVDFNGINGTLLDTIRTDSFSAALDDPQGTSFSIDFDFTTTMDWLANSQVSSIEIDGVDIDFDSILLDGFAFTKTNEDGQAPELAEIWTLVPAQTLLAGNHTLTVSGTVVGSSGGGSFGGNVNVSPVGAVPEPATWAMMLLGFGAVGFAMRRRQRPALAQIA